MTHTTPPVRTVTIHGHERAYVKVGKGPALLLIHGLGCDHRTWLPVLQRLSRHFTVIAPDLLGHGRSDKPRADYSIAGFANGMRDLLSVLGIEKATVVGHSLGGGVAMQFAYQFPERTERLLLVAPGGMGQDVTRLLRLASLPGAGPVIGALTARPVRRIGHTALHLLGASRIPRFRDAAELADIYDHVSDPAARSAMLHVVRGVIDWRGQIVTMTDRAYLTEHMPMCVIWGSADSVIPPRHAAVAAECAPTARVVVLRDSGHFPHHDDPDQFVQVLREFVTTTAPSRYHRGRWSAVLRRGAAPRLTPVSDVAQT